MIPMQLSDLYGDDPLELILLIMLLVYFPYAMYQLYVNLSLSSLTTKISETMS